MSAGVVPDNASAGPEVTATYLSGIQVLARLPIEVRRADMRAGRATAGFVSGYEGSPLGGYDLELARHQSELTEHDIVFTPGVNEELAATAVQGAQLAGIAEDRKYDGVTCYWYGKSPGLDRAADAFRHNNLMGTHDLGGVLALVGDDPAAKSSTVPGASEFLLADLGLPILYPADPQGLLDLGLHGVALSRACGLWVGLKVATAVADGRATISWDAARIKPATPDPMVNGRPFKHRMTARMLQPDLGELENSRDGARLEIARRYAAANGLNTIEGAGACARIGLVAAGKTHRDLKQALHQLGLDEDALDAHGVRLLNLAMIHPLEPTIVRRFAEGLDEIFVIEEKRPFIEVAIKNLLYGGPCTPVVCGKTDTDGRVLLPVAGELDADTIARAVAERVLLRVSVPSAERWLNRNDDAARTRRSLPLVNRTPYFCSGCPHNSSTKVPDGSLVGAGIGCHGLVMVMNPDQVGQVTGLTQMGGEGAQWVGMSPFRRTNHLFQNIGDGTFHHSGSLAIRAAISGKVNITYKLLFNSAVAMTGGQQPTGGLAIPEIIRTLRAEGVARIILTTDEPKKYRFKRLGADVHVWSRDRLEEAQTVLAAIPGVTVLIHDQECATELRRKRKRGLAETPTGRAFINERVCEGCGDCGRKSNCLSVEPVSTEFGRKTRIDQTSCNLDLACLDGDCPAFVTVVPRTIAKVAWSARMGSPVGSMSATIAPNSSPGPTLAASDLPEPIAQVRSGEYTMRLTGIGGTGVLTLAQVLGAAAALEGIHVRTLDQTGLAQKGGAVTSDVRISRAPLTGTNKISACQADLYLGCDLVVAANDTNLRVAATDRTTAVVSTTQVPTGTMVTDPNTTFPDPGSLVRRIASASNNCVALDARAASERWLGSGQYANILLAGAAYQVGALPIRAESIEAAIGANGVRAEDNIQAFRRGRQFIADPARFWAGEQRAPDPDAGKSEVRQIVARLATDLAEYQSKRYAQSYERRVNDVRAREQEFQPGSEMIAVGFARHLYKLMAYKDEYEVARLSLAQAFMDDVLERFGPGARVSYRLHPPALRALGLRHKLTLGPWIRPAFKLLVTLRFLRGTWADPFGYARVRRLERQLISEYCDAVDRALSYLTPANEPVVRQIVGLPDMVRGYEHIKVEAVERYRGRLAELEATLAPPPPQPPSAPTTSPAQTEERRPS